MTTRRCQSCSTFEKPVFYDKSLPECPECGVPKYAFNSWLRTAKLNGHLDSMASRAGN